MQRVLAHSLFVRDSRAQATPFIIIVILLIGAAVLILNLNLAPRPTTVNADAARDEIGTYVNACLSGSLKNAIGYVSNRGGYYRFPSDIPTYLNKIPYYRHPSYQVAGAPGGAQRIPDKATLSTSISDYIEDDIHNCLDSFSSFDGRGLTITKGTAAAKATLLPDKVTVSLEVPITATIPSQTTKTSTSATISSFKASQASRILSQRDAAERITSLRGTIAPVEIDKILRAIGMKSIALVKESTIIYTIKEPNGATFAFAIEG